jgi:hypothetical protein
MLTCDVSLGLDEFRGVWTDVGKPLLDTTFDVSAALTHITKQPAGQAEIRLCIRIDLEVKQIQHALIMKSEDALEDEYVWAVDRGTLPFEPGMLLERVNRDVNLFPLRVLANYSVNHGDLFPYPDLISRR